MSSHLAESEVRTAASLSSVDVCKDRLLEYCRLHPVVMDAVIARKKMDEAERAADGSEGGMLIVLYMN